jgi:hypothetical protein
MSEQISRRKEQTSQRHGGRIASPYPEFMKKLRATEEERMQFLDLLRIHNPTGDTRQDFLILVDLLKQKED